MNLFRQNQLVVLCDAQTIDRARVLDEQLTLLPEEQIRACRREARGSTPRAGRDPDGRSHLKNSRGAWRFHSEMIMIRITLYKGESS